MFKRLLISVLISLLVISNCYAANVLNTNPIQLDTSGATSAISTAFMISGIVVVASGDTWSCIIHDAASGDIIFRADSALGSERMAIFSPAESVPVSGLYWTTDTNIAIVLVYIGSGK